MPPESSPARHAGPTRVCLVEDHHVVRQGMALLLERSGFTVAGSVGTAAEAVDAVESGAPDVVVVDVVLPDEPATSLVRRLKARWPDLRILLYTGSTDAEALVGVLESGAHGLVSKGSDPDEFRRAVATVRDGRAFIDDALRPLLSGASAGPRVLTDREGQIFCLLAAGLSGEEVARQLVLSPETVRTHIRNASTKLGARTRAHALVLALRRGEIQP